MGKVCVRGFAVSIDGFAAGPEQSLEHPMGVGGGAATVRQYLLAGAINEMHLAVSPIVLGRGEPLFAGIDLPGLGYRVTETVATALATHIVLTR